MQLIYIYIYRKQHHCSLCFICFALCHFLGQCSPLPPLSKGTLTLVAGNGTSVGTVMTLVCPRWHRPISGGLITCVQESNSTQWSGGTPQCKGKTCTNHDTVCLLTLDMHETTAIGVPLIHDYDEDEL